MIIPIRCMNCGNLLADKWLFYQQEVKRLRDQASSSSSSSSSSSASEDSMLYMDGKSVPDTPENKVLNALGLRRYCCRKHMLTHVDLMDKI